MWNSHERFSSIKRPTNLKLFSLLSVPIWSISVLSMTSLRLVGKLFLVFGLNKMYFVFFVFNVSKLALNHSEMSISSLFALWKRAEMSQDDSWRVVSSAKISLKKPDEFGRSFIYKRNKRGPKILPCGTPQLIFCFLEFTPSIETNCCLFER